MMRRRRDRDERPARKRDREQYEYESRRHGFEESPRDAPSDDEHGQLQSAMYLSAEKQHARQQLEARNMRSATSAVIARPPRSTSQKPCERPPPRLPPWLPFFT